MLDTLEHVGNKAAGTKNEQPLPREFTMLATTLTLAIALLFTLTGIVALLAIVDAMLKAHRAYAVLMREAALMRDGFAFQVEARELRVRRAVVRAMPLRRSPALRRLPAPAVPAYAAA
jgi:Zn-dependent protease with chaperone function